MPSLETTIHLDMLAHNKRSRVVRRLRLAKKALASGEAGAAIRALFLTKDLYGLEWGDPDVLPFLRNVRDHFIDPYVTPATTVLEIGPGGGRWTRYMLQSRRLYLIDYHQELLDELARSFRGDNLTLIRNNGSDFPGVPPGSVDFLFSFGCFVHLDLDIIEAYLDNIRAVLKPDAIVVLQYSDMTKEAARAIVGFADNDPARMRERVLARGYTIYEEDTTSIGHSAIVRFGLSPTDPSAR